MCRYLEVVAEGGGHSQEELSSVLDQIHDIVSHRSILTYNMNTCCKEHNSIQGTGAN